MEINKEQFIETIAERFSIAKYQAAVLVDAFATTLNEHIQAGNNVSIDGLGSFKVFNLFPSNFDPKAAKSKLAPYLNKKIVYFEKDSNG